MRGEPVISGRRVWGKTDMEYGLEQSADLAEVSRLQSLYLGMQAWRQDVPTAFPKAPDGQAGTGSSSHDSADRRSALRGWRGVASYGKPWLAAAA